MPYIPQGDRESLIGELLPQTAGELTFVIYHACLAFLEDDDHEPRFADYAKALGALEAAKLELYRQYVSPYEDNKLDLHGDVEV